MMQLLVVESWAEFDIFHGKSLKGELVLNGNSIHFYLLWKSCLVSISMQKNKYQHKVIK